MVSTFKIAHEIKASQHQKEYGQVRALASREDANRTGKISTIIFIRDKNARGQEISGYIDYAHRLKTEDFSQYFMEKKKILPRPGDLSHADEEDCLAIEWKRVEAMLSSFRTSCPSHPTRLNEHWILSRSASLIAARKLQPLYENFAVLTTDNDMMMCVKSTKKPKARYNSPPGTSMANGCKRKMLYTVFPKKEKHLSRSLIRVNPESSASLPEFEISSVYLTDMQHFPIYGSSDAAFYRDVGLGKVGPKNRTLQSFNCDSRQIIHYG
ncbi:hypothetical protein CLF_105142 [Clonorchis sinensis]|uniref:Cilia- and flagella-associated protein 299 n=1 Tax=Clonorchis sinensis TaxID=79923 RepID=G7YD19_CLOSI|nr:hypothetical protein CLF_105142 [Clonorchis sinensis]